MVPATGDKGSSSVIPAICSCLLGVMILAGCALPPRFAPTSPSGSQTRLPYLTARSSAAEYYGPGREYPPPEEVTEVRIGWFGPADPNHPTAGLMWLAAAMAVDEANQTGGYRGVPFRLLSAWSENPWDTGITGLIRLVYEEDVWAVAGGPDGTSAHLVEQVVAKSRLAYISPVATDRTANLANVPWIFSLAPSDDLLADVLAEQMLTQGQGGRLVVVSCTDHDSRMFAAEMLEVLRRHASLPVAHLEFSPGTVIFDTQMAGLSDARPDAVFIAAGPEDAARFIVSLRANGWNIPVFGGPELGRRRFTELAGPAAAGVVFPVLWQVTLADSQAAEDGPAGASSTFARRFYERWGSEPDYTAAYTYDAMRLLIAAIRRAGLNRALIRDALRDVSPDPGPTGPITWSTNGRRQ